jgi:beta-glucanase (GH16 family)
MWHPNDASTDAFPAVGGRAGTAKRRPRRGRLIGWSVAGVIVICAVVVGAFLVAPRNGSHEASSNSGTTAQSDALPAVVPGASSKASVAKPKPPMPPSSLGTNWALKFNAGFSGSKLDTSMWGTCYPWEAQSGCANYGNSNLEYQWYQPSQDEVQGGTLNIVAQQTPTEGLSSSGGPEGYSFRSGMVTSFPSYQFQYGYLQVVARVPTAKGLWSALWLAAANEQWPPEIDIMEHWDNQAKFWQYYHPSNAPRENGSSATTNLSGWNTFGLYWDQSQVTWYVNGKAVFTTSRNVPQQPMYFLANVAVYENAIVGSDDTMQVKSVKVWQRS